MCIRDRTWATTKIHLSKLQFSQNSMLRSILGIRLEDKINLEDIYSKTRAKKVGVIVKTLKY